MKLINGASLSSCGRIGAVSATPTEKENSRSSLRQDVKHAFIFFKEEIKWRKDYWLVRFSLKKQQ